MRKPKSNPVINLADIRAHKVDLSRGTLAEAWAIYEASMALERLKPTSRAVYRYAAKIAIEQLPARPRAGDVTLWLEQLQRDGRASATCNKYLKALKAITERADNLSRGGARELRQAFRSQYNFKIPAQVRRDAKQATVARLLELAENHREILAVRLAAFYGLRRGEILAIKASDVRGEVITVTHTRDTYGYRPRKNAQNQRMHCISLEGDEETQVVLRQAIKEAGEYLVPWTTQQMSRVMNKWRQDPQVMLPHGDSWHALRHYGATQLAEAGHTVTEIQGWLGDTTVNSACCYIGQTRGSTYGTAKSILNGFKNMSMEQSSYTSQAKGSCTSSKKSEGKRPPPATKN